MKFAVIIEKTDIGVKIYAPYLPRCAATGVTFEEVKLKLQEIIEFRFKRLLEEGRPIPEPVYLLKIRDLLIELPERWEEDK